MKKRLSILFILCMTVIFFLAIPIMAMAEGTIGQDTTGPVVTLPDTFFSWEGIATFSGAVAAVVFIVQLFKLPLDKIGKIPTQYIVYLVSVGVLLLAQAFVPSLGGLSWQTGILCLVNGGLVALAAMSTYDVAIKRVEQSKQGIVYSEAIEGSFDLPEETLDKLAAAVAAKIKAETSATGT